MDIIISFIFSVIFLAVSIVFWMGIIDTKKTNDLTAFIAGIVWTSCITMLTIGAITVFIMAIIGDKL
jgi:hypothetical protein